MEFRIGINLGDVIVEGDDIHGDGVNIADRMQALAEPGGIAISGTAYDHVKAKLPVGYASLGEQKVKSIAEPVRVYRVLMDPAAAGRTVAAASNCATRFACPRQRLRSCCWSPALRPWPGGGPGSRPRETARHATRGRRAVGQAVARRAALRQPERGQEQGYLADGMTEDMTTELARIPGLFVISRNAAFTYKGKAVQPAQVGKELGVRYILEGSIRRAGDNLRINAQLIDTANSGHLWAERFDGAWGEVFALQDQVIKSVADALELRLVSGPRLADAPGATTVPAAYDLYLRAFGLDYGKFPAEVASLLRQAVALDPNFGQAWAELGWLYWNSMGIEEAERALGISRSQMPGKIKEFLSEAEKHPSSNYYTLMADLLLWQRKSDEAIASAGRAIALDPSTPWAYSQMSLALALNGRAADARDYLAAAARVDPQPNPYRHFLAGLIAFCMEEFDDAVASLEKATFEEIGTDNNRRQRLYLLAAAHAHLGHTSEAAAARTELEAIRGNESGLTSHARVCVQAAKRHRAPVEGPEQSRPAGLSLRLGREESTYRRGDPLARLRSRAPRPPSRPGRALCPHDDGGRRRACIRRLVIFVHGISRIDGDFMCTLFDAEVEVLCAAIFRNPGGTPEKQNEYVWVIPNNHLEFSRIK